MTQLIAWDLYEITSSTTSLIGVKLRGTLRKFAFDNAINLLAENATDKENCVRFGVLSGSDVHLILEFIAKTFIDTNVESVMENINNPVLSKLKVNDISRY